MTERSIFRAWAPSAALVAVPALAVALAVSLVPSRFKTPARRSSAAFGASAFSDGAGTIASTEAAPTEDTAPQPVEPAAVPEEGLGAAAAPDPPATELADAATGAAADPPIAGSGDARPSAGAPSTDATAPAASPTPQRPLVTVWPSARKRRQAARLAAAEAAAAETPETSQSDSADAASAAAAAAVPNIVYVPLFMPLPFMEGSEDAAPVENEPQPSSGFQAVIVINAD